MKITAATAYAITAVVHIANAPTGEQVANSAICEAHNLPQRFVLQVLRRLVNDGILASTRGVFGGYKLAKPANKITLLEIVEAVEGRLEYGVPCDLALMTKAKSRVGGAFEAMEADARKRLGAVTAADLRAGKA
jgi:Rrf2 family protein